MRMGMICKFVYLALEERRGKIHRMRRGRGSSLEWKIDNENGNSAERRKERHTSATHP